MKIGFKGWFYIMVWGDYLNCWGSNSNVMHIQLGKEYTFIRTLCKDFLLQAAFQMCFLMLQAMTVVQHC